MINIDIYRALRIFNIPKNKARTATEVISRYIDHIEGELIFIRWVLVSLLAVESIQLLMVFMPLL